MPADDGRSAETATKQCARWHLPPLLMTSAALVCALLYGLLCKAIRTQIHARNG